MNKLKIKKDDTVIVITGKDEGKKGKILSAMPKENRVIVQNVNVVMRHTKPRKQGEPGGRISKEAPIHASNVMLVCPRCNKPTRVGYGFETDGKGAVITVAKKQEASQAQPKKKKDQQEAKPFSGPARLRLKYRDEIAPQLKEKFGYKNIMEIPKLEKIVLNMGLGSEKDNPKGLEAAIEELAIIAGQRPIVTKAKKSVANFKVREGMNVGAKVTLRGDRMYYFADKLMNIVLPRVRDFRGVSDKSFDGRGNYAMGVREQLIFPEINYDDVDKTRGMDIVFVTSAKSDEESKELLSLLGMPFIQG